MAKTSECIGCSDLHNGYRTDIQSKINRNVGLAVQHNGNGTIQYMTNLSVSLGKLWFRYPINALCEETIDETQIPNKIKLLFSSELTEILESISINPTDGNGPEQSLSTLLQQIKDPDSLGEILPIIEIDANNLKEEILKTPFSEEIACKESTHNIITLKPEVWEGQEKVSSTKELFVHDGKKFKQVCSGNKIVPAVRKIGNAKKPKYVEIPYVKGEFGIQLGSGRIYTYNGTSSTDASTQIKPPQSERDCIIVPNPNDVKKTIIPWILSIVPRNTNTTIEQLKNSTVEKILNCKGVGDSNFKAWKEGRNKFIRFYKNNIVGLCRLLKYSESLEDNILNCKVEFYKDDVLLKPSNTISKIKVSFFAGFLDEQAEDSLDFNAALNIQILIDDKNLRAPADPRPDFVRLKCPAFKNLGELSKIEDYITADLVTRNEGEEQTEIYILDNTIYSQEYPYCDKETKDIPKGDLLLALDRSDSKVNDIWKGFLEAVETGIMCSVSGSGLMDNNDLEDTLTNNIKLSNYKSEFGAPGENMTFYSHKLYQIEERQPNNEIVIRNKNLPAEDANAYIDCITGLFIDKVELDTSLLENTFFTDYKVNPDDHTHKFKPYRCESTGEDLVAAQDLFLQARVDYPVYILRKLPNAKTEYIKHTVSVNINLPFKSKLTENSILWHEKNNDCDYFRIPIKATVQGQESIKPFFQHFATKRKVEDFFFNIKFENGQKKYHTGAYYQKLLPHFLKINQDKLEQEFGKDFEYEPAQNEETGFLKIIDSKFTFNQEDDKTLPCREKVIEAISNLAVKKSRAELRYHKPLIDWLSTIHVVDNNFQPIENFINESVMLTTTKANQAFYRKVLGGRRPYTWLQNGIISGKDSFIKRTYETSDPKIYNKNIETYHNKKPFLALIIHAPKAPEIDPPNLEKMLSETSNNNLLLPGVYSEKLFELEQILKDPRRYRQQCGRGILGEGEK